MAQALGALYEALYQRTGRHPALKETAEAWYWRAFASSGSASAATDLGELRALEATTSMMEADDESAAAEMREWYMKAATRGHARAALNLGLLARAAALH